MAYATLDAAREIGKLREGVAVMRILQAHGLNVIAKYENGKLIEHCTINRMIEEMK